MLRVALPRCARRRHPLWRQPVRQSSHRAPPTAPPSFVRGTCGGIFEAVGRETGSLRWAALTLKNPIPPTLRPPPGGDEESEQEDQFFRTPKR